MKALITIGTFNLIAGALFVLPIIWHAAHAVAKLLRF